MIIALTVVAKVLISIAAIGGTAIGLGVGIGAATLYHKNNSDDESMPVYKEMETRYEVHRANQEKELDMIVKNTEKTSGAVLRASKKQTKKITKASTQLTDQSSLIAQETTALKALVTQLKSDILSRDEQLKILLVELEAQKAMVTALSKELLEYKVLLTKKNGELTMLQRQLSDELSALQYNKQEVEKLRAQITSLTEGQRQLRQTKTSFKDCADSAQKRISFLTHNLETAMETIKKQRDTISRYEARITALEEEKSTVTNRTSSTARFFH